MSRDQLYEIHITIDFLSKTYDEMKFLWFCREHNWHFIRHCNLTGHCPVQVMMGKWCKRSNHQEATDYAEKLASFIRGEGFTVTRVKAEAMLESNMDTVLTGEEQGKYWEFHFKVVVAGLADMNRLEKTLEGKKHVGVSCSSSSSTGHPVVTIRLFQGSADDALAVKDNIVDHLKGAGFHIASKLQSELSVYDTCPEMDHGWLC